MGDEAGNFSIAVLHSTNADMPRCQDDAGSSPLAAGGAWLMSGEKAQLAYGFQPTDRMPELEV